LIHIHPSLYVLIYEEETKKHTEKPVFSREKGYNIKRGTKSNIF